MRHPAEITPQSTCQLITKRESQILHLVAYEYSTKEIAAMLFLSSDTVNSHRKNMMRKLQVKNTAGLVRVAFERSILKIFPISEEANYN